MGALPFAGGVFFRVWAPHADSVAVIGDFNDWSESANPLSSEGNGFWYGEVAEAAVGQEYRYHIVNGDQQFSRIDPYARQVTNSVGNGVIYAPHAFDWEGDDFTLPAHNELVIYEMHVGSFFPQQEGEVGDFDSVLKRLDYLQRLGINAIQVTAICPGATTPPTSLPWKVPTAAPTALKT